MIIPNSMLSGVILSIFSPFNQATRKKTSQYLLENMEKFQEKVPKEFDIKQFLGNK